MRTTVTGYLLVLGISLAAGAQDGAKVSAGAQPNLTSTVSGTIMFADTNGPARFARVLLKNAAPADPKANPFGALFEDEDDEKGAKKGAKGAKSMSAEDQAEKKASLDASMQVMSVMADMLVSATVAADGTYLFAGVKPGKYYVHAMAPGYIDPLAQFNADELTSTDPAVRARVAAAATLITVTGTEGARADLRLERGAAISGRVLYDDGTPATGWTVRTVRANAPAAAAAFGTMGLDSGDLDLTHLQEASKTDDTGYFRIAGLESGQYVLQARLTTTALQHGAVAGGGAGGGGMFGSMAGMMGLKLTVFSGNVTRQSDAKPIDVKAGQERTGYDLAIPLHLMHTVGGVVRAKLDGHPVSGGTVEISLVDATGKEDASMHWSAQIQGDGTFAVDYLPGPGTFALKTTHAVDSTTTGSTRVLGTTIPEKKVTHSYGQGTATVVLGDGDISDVKIDVPEKVEAK